MKTVPKFYSTLNSISKIFFNQFELSFYILEKNSQILFEMVSYDVAPTLGFSIRKLKVYLLQNRIFTHHIKCSMMLHTLLK